MLGSDYHSSAPPGLANENYLSYAELQPVRGGIDLILLRHVLEHTYHPVALLHPKLEGLLRPGGVIVIQLPNLEAGVRHLFGRDWNGWYVPCHNFLHFTRRSLQMVIEGAGLQVELIRGADMPMMGRSLQVRRRSDYGLGLMLLEKLSVQPAQACNRVRDACSSQSPRTRNPTAMTRQNVASRQLPVVRNSAALGADLERQA